MTIAEQLAAHVALIREKDLAPTTLHAARRCLLDWLAATTAGGVHEPATLIAQAFAVDAPGSARLYPSGKRVAPRNAALINGTASHIVEVDDIFRAGLYHPGSPTIAAAIAAAEDVDANGEELLKAIVAGYEISNRIARTMGASHYEYWHMTATVGYFGAAASSACILNLTEKETAHALAQAATWAAGLKQAFASDAMSKPIHAGRSAEGGLTAAMMARAGVTAVLDMLEGKRGFGSAMARAPDWKSAVADLGTRATIEETTVKYHACCGHTFAAIDGAMELADRHDLQPEDIATIGIATYSQGVEVCGNESPATPAEARFSLPYCVATAVLNRAPCAPQHFTNAAIADVEVRALMKKVTIASSPECDAVFPQNRSAFVTITTADGASHSTHRKTRIGDPDLPLTDEQLNAKFTSLAAPILGAEQAQALQQRVWQLSEDDRIAALPIGKESRSEPVAAE